MFLFFIGKQLEISFQNVLFFEIQVDTKAYFFNRYAAVLTEIQEDRALTIQYSKTIQISWK